MKKYNLLLIGILLISINSFAQENSNSKQSNLFNYNKVSYEKLNFNYSSKLNNDNLLVQTSRVQKNIENKVPIDKIDNEGYLKAYFNKLNSNSYQYLSENKMNDISSKSDPGGYVISKLLSYPLNRLFQKNK